MKPYHETNVRLTWLQHRRPVQARRLRRQHRERQRYFQRRFAGDQPRPAGARAGQFRLLSATHVRYPLRGELRRLSMAGDWQLEDLYHTVVNVKDLDESGGFLRAAQLHGPERSPESRLAGLRRHHLRYAPGQGPGGADGPAQRSARTYDRSHPRLARKPSAAFPDPDKVADTVPRIIPSAPKASTPPTRN